MARVLLFIDTRLRCPMKTFKLLFGPFYRPHFQWRFVNDSSHRHTRRRGGTSGTDSGHAPRPLRRRGPCGGPCTICPRVFLPRVTGRGSRSYPRSPRGHRCGPLGVVDHQDDLAAHCKVDPRSVSPGATTSGMFWGRSNHPQRSHSRLFLPLPGTLPRTCSHTPPRCAR